jgi:ribonucleoside-diphosphate reductase alpha chain
MPGGTVVMNVQDYGHRFLKVDGRTTASVTVDEHMAVMLCAASKVDSAVSKTVNVDKHVSWEDFKGIYLKAFEGGAKGCTTFNKDGKRFALLVDKDGDDRAPEPVPAPVAAGGESCQIDFATGRRSCE